MAEIEAAPIYRWACWTCKVLGWCGDPNQARAQARDHIERSHDGPIASDIMFWGIHHWRISPRAIIWLDMDLEPSPGPEHVVLGRPQGLST